VNVPPLPEGANVNVKLRVPEMPLNWPVALMIVAVPLTVFPAPEAESVVAWKLSPFGRLIVIDTVTTFAPLAEKFALALPYGEIVPDPDPVPECP